MLPFMGILFFVVVVSTMTFINAVAFQSGVTINRMSRIQQSGHSTLKKISSLSSSSTTADDSSGASTSTTDSKSYLYDPEERDDHYQGNIAQYLLDLNDEKSNFNFCGGKIDINVLFMYHDYRIICIL